MQRRTFLRQTTAAATGLSLLGLSTCGSTNNAATEEVAEEPQAPASDLWFDISLAQWSLNKALFSGEMDNLDFARVARETFGLGGIEYVNQFFKDKATNSGYLGQMKQRAEDHGVRSLLIMIDGEGDLGSTDAAERQRAIENHHRWVDAAKFLGCHSIRVNAAGQGSREEVAKAATEGLRMLSEYAQPQDINVIVENHGGYSRDGQWLASVIENTEMVNCGTLPDFGNFCIERGEEGEGCKNMYDIYRGIEELMPYAYAVSAKSYTFDAEGNEPNIDFQRILRTVKNAGYTGWIGIEYEGDSETPEDGIRKTAELLRRAGSALS